jgi:hypothetical protein
MASIHSLCASDVDPWLLVDAINSLSKVIPVVSPALLLDERINKLPAFLEWLGSTSSNLRIDSSIIPGAGLAVYATKSIPLDNEIFKVPVEKTLSLKDADQSLVDLISKDQILAGNNSLQLAILLLVEDSKSDSLWRPYLDILPREFPSLPCNMARSQLEYFKGWSFIAKFQDRALFLLCSGKSKISRVNFSILSRTRNSSR